MTTAAWISHQLQILRDFAERESRETAERGDRDSAEAYERIGLAIDATLATIKHDIAIAAARAGLFDSKE